MSDEEWVTRMLEGDEVAFEQLIRKYRQDLYAAIYAVLRHAKDAEDALQDTFVAIYLSLPGYRQQGLKTWMTRIAVNKAIDHKRRQQRLRQRSVLTDQPERAEPPPQGDEADGRVAERLLEAERRETMSRFIGTMPEGYRRVIEAFYWQGKNQQEIAKGERVAAKTIESRLYRARQWMRERWKRGEEQE
ncbi:RNA polymerase sigma factor [Paenibacillus sp. 1P07SE]|uniref:RNA polymerase sigma factor n=1 Tax=Paenibacillus sp. 1P07SE TaxID=3132209 RepID=UPI0039A72EAF